MFKRLKDLFVSHAGNNFRPDFLERLSVGIMLVLILLSFTMANLQALLWISSDWLVSTVLPAVIVDLTNGERGDANLRTLTRNPLLDSAATLKAEDMAKNEYFAHYSPTGVSPWYWFDQVSYNYLHAGENLAVHFTDSGDVVQAWMNSPSHRANIMNGDYTEIGVGSAKGEYKGQSTIYVVQLFGTQREVPVLSNVAGVSTDTEDPQISVEKVVITDDNPTTTIVAPATIDTVTLVQEPVSTTNEPIEKNEVVSVHSDLATTSRDGVLAVITPDSSGGGTPESIVSIPLRSTTEPSLWLTTLYGFLASIVVLALVLSIRFEWRTHHPVQVAYAGGLLVVMAMLLYVHVSLTGIVTIV